MNIFRTLYAKIFGWFWLTLTVGSLLVVLATVFTGTQPLGRRWMRLTQDLYAHTAVDFYESGGKPALTRYLNILEESSGIQASLLDGDLRDVVDSAVPPDIGRVLQRSVDTGESTFQLGRIWTAASPVRYGQQQFYFVIEIHPMRGFFNGRTFALPLLGRLALALLVAGIFCLILTRHIVAPVRALQAAALRLAGGDLSTRVVPVIAPRDDELADTARAFDQMADRIQLLIQKRQELLADISHELRSPLTRLSVSLELLRRGETDVVEKMETDIERMNAMIGQILLLTRLDLQPLQAGSVPVEVAPMLRSIAGDAEFEMQDENKTISVHVQGSCSVRGDPNLLRSCIENVVRNAMHYTEPHTAVEMSARMVTDASGRAQCEITVLDHGPGVPENSLPFLFDPFYRVSESRDLREGGTGLGLSISQKIVDLHRGTIHAANRKDGAGLQVRLVLPSI
jgi:two-component system, OmpR family, sensor histidine kinase CpxA